MALVTTTYPGVYVSESTDVPHVVVPATTNLTAFIGQFPSGPTDRAQLVSSWQEFVAVYGGLRFDSLASYGVFQFFANGGIGAWIVRVAALPTKAEVAGGQGGTGGESDDVKALPCGLRAGSFVYTTTDPKKTTTTPLVWPLQIKANSVGSWAEGFRLTLTLQQLGRPGHQNLIGTLVLTDPQGNTVETLTELAAWSATKSTDYAELATSINEQSSYLTASPLKDDTVVPVPALPVATKTQPTKPPAPPPADAPPPGVYTGTLHGGKDPTLPADQFLTLVEAQLGTGDTMPLLDKIAPLVFNLLAIPDAAVLPVKDQVTLYGAAIAYATEHRAFVLVDPPPPTAVEKAMAKWPVPPTPGPDMLIDTVGDGTSKAMFDLTASSWATGLLNEKGISGAVYYPWVQILDPIDKQRPRFVPPSGTVAGLYAANDVATGGPWTAPAGTDLVLGGVTDLADATITDPVQGTLNVAGVNCLRTFPIYGRVVWGTRTLAGSDLADSPWKYIPVRRMANFIELSLQQSLKWAVFQPNNTSLWASIAQEVGGFMGNLFSQGAFGGTTAASAFSVVCDATTTSPTDQETGRVNVQVAFVPVYPAEFVVLNVELAAALPAAS